MKLHTLVTEDHASDAIKLDDILDELETDLSTFAVLVKKMGPTGVRPTSNYLKRIWLAHEKLGDIYEAVEKAKRS